MIAWRSRKQTSMALSTMEVEYIVACATCSEAVWLQKMLSGLFDLQLEATWIYCNNRSCIKLSKNLVFHDKSKHIEIKYQYIRDMVEKGASLHCYGGADRGRIGQALVQAEVGVLQRQAWCGPSQEGVIKRITDGLILVAEMND